MSKLETTFRLQYHDSPTAGRLAILTMDNDGDHRRPTTFGATALGSLSMALDDIESTDDVHGLLLTGKPFIFAAGANLDEFHGVDADFAREAGAAGHRVFGRLAQLTFPTLAAINGVCMGGGLEIALHCDYRTLSTSAAALAFPEVFLSIVPAWGGTQLTPRLVGAPRAIKVIVEHALSNNRTMKPRQAFDLGLADELIPAVDFLDQSVTRLEHLVRKGLPDRANPDHGDIDALMAGARAAVDGVVHGATDAPYRALDLIEFAARGGDLAEGLKREEEALAELLPARQAQASVYAFGLTQQRVKRQPWRPDAPARELRKVGVVGSGLMGAQLGALLLGKLEVPLVMKDLDDAVLDTAQASIDGEIDKRVERGRLHPGKGDFLKSLVSYTTENVDLSGCDLVLEAVVERLDVKQRLFADLEAVVDTDCVLATNTSSLSVSAMAEALAHPGRVVGVHFFNPVAVLPLVEVISGTATDAVTLATAFDLCKKLGKSAVGCADAPAFVVNRLLTRFMGACAKAVRPAVHPAKDGIGFRQVDDAIKELGLPMGPFELLGLVGPAVAAHVARTLHDAYPDRFPLDENMQYLGASGLPGVYDLAGDVHADVVERWTVDPHGEPLTPHAIRDQALRATADEIRHLLDEGVVGDARDVDTCMLLGAGWPFFMGGVCRYLDQVGLSQELFGEPLVGLHGAAA